MSNLRDPFFAPSTVSLDEMEQLRASGMGSLRRGWESGLIGADANSLRAKEYGLRADGNVAEADALLPQIQGLRQRQAMYAPEVQKVEDADGIGSGLSWLGGQIGQGAASMATPMAATTALSAVGTLGGMIPGPVGTAAKLVGTVGAPLAAFGINQRQMKGEWLENAVQDKALMEQHTPEQLNRAANIQGVIGGALDTVLPTVVGRQLAGTGLRKGMDALGFGGRVATNLLGEGATEVLQGESGRQTHGYMNPNRDTSGDMSDRLNELAGGMAGSSPFGVAGAAADTAYRGVGTAGAKVKNAAGQVVDLAQEAYDGSTLQGAVDKGVDKVTNFVGSAKRKTGDIVDMARGEDGKVDLGKALDLADQEIQARAKEYVGADQGAMPAFTLDDRERDLFDFDERRPGAVPEDILNAAPEVQQKWFADHDALRADAVATRLAEIEGTSPEATALLDRIEQGDYAAVDEGAKFLLGRADEQEYRDLNTRAGLAKSVAEKALGAAGKAVGKAATAATPYIGKAAGMAGKGIVAGARGVMDMGKAVAQGAKDEYQNGKKLNAQGMDGGRNPALRDALVKAGYATTQEVERGPGDVFRDILTAELSNTGRPVNEALSGYIGGLGAELNALADSWGSRNPKDADAGKGVGPTTGSTQARGLGLRVGAIANDLRIAYGAKAPAVVQQMRDVADPAAGPMFDMLGEQLAKSGTPQGRREREQLRVSVANQLMRYVPPEQAAQLQAAGKDYRQQLLGAIERIADGTANPSVRPALIEALGGGKQGEATLRTMMDIVNGATPEPERANEAAMFADSPGVDDPTGDDIGSDADGGDVNDFEKRQAEKSVRRGTAPAIYGYGRSSALRTSSEKNFNPFAPSGSGGKRPNLVTMEDRDTTTGNRTVDNRVARMEAQLGMARTPERMVEILREEKDNKQAGEIELLMSLRNSPKAKAQLADAVKSFFVNRSGEYSVRARSAQDVMDELGYQPTKQLAIYRDYLKQEGNEEAANEVRVAIAAISRNSKNTKIAAAQGRVAAPEFTEQIEKVQRDARAYFRDRYMAVAEQLSGRTPEKLTAQEVLVFNDQAKRAMHNIEGAVYKQGLKGEDAEKAQNRMISDANILVFESKSGKPVMVRANALAGWARAQRDTYETVTKDGSEDFGSFSSRTKDDQFVEDLLSGINAVLASGAVRGTNVEVGQNTYTAKLPYKINPFGKREQFGDPKFPGGLPPSLGLATETEFTRQGRREKRTAEITRAERVFGPPQALDGNPTRDASVDVEYQERIAIDQARGERERKSIDGGDERTPVIESLNAESLMTPQESRHYGRLKTAKGRKDFLKRLELRGEGAKFNTNTTIDEALIDYDDEGEGKTALDFGRADRRDADEFEDAQFRNKNSGKSVYDPLPFESKLDAARKADERSGPILRALMGDFREKDELGGMFGRDNSDPGATARAQGLQMLAQRIEAAAGVQRGSTKMTGGVQYLYPAAKVLNPYTINSLAQVDGAPETFRRDLVALRRQAVQALKAAGENASTMHKVNLMRLMAGDPRTVTSTNVDAVIDQALAPRAPAAAPAAAPAPQAAPEVAATNRPKFRKPRSGADGRKLNAQTFSGRAGRPVFTDRVPGDDADQKLAQKLNDILPGNDSGRRGVSPANPDDPATARILRIAERFGKRVVWVEGLGADGLYWPAVSRDAVFLDPDSGRSAAVLIAHELAHTVERDRPDVFTALVDAIRPHLDAQQWAAFVRRQQAGLTAGERPLSAHELRAEMVANLTADYAHRSFAGANTAEDATRGVEFSGYGAYLKPGARASVDAAIERALNAVGRGRQSFRNAQADAGATAAKGPGLTAAQEREVRAYVDKVLGPKIKVVFSDTMQHSGEWDPATQTIKIATAAASGVNSAAYHEALHAFFGAYAENDPKMLRVMQSLTDDPKTMERVQALLYKYPAAQAQLTDGEERMAYIYQFWAAGQLDLPAGKAKTWLQKLSKFFRQALGLVKDSERAVELLEAFHGGELREPSVAAKVIADLTADKAWTVKARRNFDGLLQQVGRLTMPAQDILRDSPSKAAQSLMAAFYANPGDEAGGGQGEGYLNARKSESIRRKNALARAIEGLSERDQLDVVKALQQGVDPQDIAELPYAPVRAAVGAIRAELDDFHDYMTAKGLTVGRIKDYFPVVWSTAALQDKRDEFISMLMTKYRKEINGDPEKAEALYQGLISRTIADGIVNPNRDDGVMSPAFESMEERKLDWIKPEDREPFLNKSLVGTLTKYFDQGVRRAEYTARFGEDGGQLSRQLEIIQDELKAEGQAMVKRGELKDADAGKKWAARQYRDVSQAVGAMSGTLGKDISEGWRKATSWATVYQNVRLLPLSIFASMVDPLSIVARGADFKLAGEVFMNGMREVFKNWKEMITGMPEERQKTEWENIAELVGATEAAMFAHHVADEYASEYMSPRARKINDFLFRANGMESWNRQMRVGATKGAVLFIEKHSKLPEAHSQRWLAELGLKAEDVVFNQDGRMILDARELALQTGMDMKKAKEQASRLKFAVNRWVEGGVLTPNSAQRPAWSSDPRWAFLFHLKQFTYSFHQTILKRAWNELKHGNMAPMGVMAWAVPTMIAADVVKGMVTGLGELPAHMKGYDMADWFKHGVDRAGLTGYGQLGMEAVSDPASLGGPMVEQIIDAFRQPLKETAVEAMPLMPIYKRAMI